MFSSLAGTGCAPANWGRLTSSKKIIFLEKISIFYQPLITTGKIRANYLFNTKIGNDDNVHVLNYQQLA
jgi:hypothetical protein